MKTARRRPGSPAIPLATFLGRRGHLPSWTRLKTLLRPLLFGGARACPSRSCSYTGRQGVCALPQHGRRRFAVYHWPLSLGPQVSGLSLCPCRTQSLSSTACPVQRGTEGDRAGGAARRPLSPLAPSSSVRPFDPRPFVGLGLSRNCECPDYF